VIRTLPGVIHTALRSLAHAWGRSLILTACVAVALALPVATRVVAKDFEASLRARAADVPLIVGAKGSRYDLAFAALYFRPGDLHQTPLRVARRIQREPGVLALPIHAGFTAQSHPVVAVPFEYLEQRNLAIAKGRPFVRAGEALLGAELATKLNLTVGDQLFTDQRRQFDVTTPPALKLNVAGVLQPANAPEDRAVLVDLQTAWVLEGLAHGHDDPETIAADTNNTQKLVLGRTDEHIALSGAAVTYQEITQDNAATFHFHGDPDDLPVSAVLVYPDSEKTRTILATRLNASDAQQAIIPSRVIDDLMAYVVRVKSLIDAIAALLALVTLGLLALIALLTARLRAAESRTLAEIGCPPAVNAALLAAEGAVILLLGALAALALTALAATLSQQLIPFIAA